MGRGEYQRLFAEVQLSMAEHERTTWNERYRDLARGPRSPEAFLVRAYENFIEPLFPLGGTAIDVAGGAGRHAIFIAQRGAGPDQSAPRRWRVTLTDISEVGLERAQEDARRVGVKLDFICADTRSVDFGREQYDLVIVFFYLEREILPRLAEALRPGGLVVYKTYTCEHKNFATKGPQNPEYFLQPNELLHAFPGFRILLYEETVRECGLAELVARKPK